MANNDLRIGDELVIEPDKLQELMKILNEMGYTIYGPTIHRDTIYYDELTRLEELPIGLTDEQDGGTFRLKKRQDQALFGYTVGQQSWKKYLLPYDLPLWKSKRNHNGFDFEPTKPDKTKRAFLGVRSCDVHAIAIQDKILIDGPYEDPHYRSRRHHSFIIAVNCTQTGGTCFCASMNAGPTVTSGFDLAFTEIIDNNHYLLVQIGSKQGIKTMKDMPFKIANDEQKRSAVRALSKAAKQMGRTLNTDNIRDLLFHNFEHPRWQDVAKRCLSCSNCTLVCPTCFCVTIEERSDLTGNYAERWRKLDSCFTLDHSYIHGGSVRYSTLSRYRQWMIHKLASWIDQFGMSGCVGCGRRITWCPVGIDITEEAGAIRASDKK